MGERVYKFWERVIYSIFSLPTGIVIGLLACWILSFYDPSIQGFGVYVLAGFLGIGFTTLVSLIFPKFTGDIITFFVTL